MRPLAALVCAALFGCSAPHLQESAPPERAPEPATVERLGPLQVHPQNRRYFADGNGRPVYLTGSHTWANFQDFSAPPFDYSAYLGLLVNHGHNFIRLWQWESQTFDVGPGTIAPLPYLQTGGRFDLNRFNPDFFRLLRARVEEAGRKGVYVSVLLFQQYINWDSHPLNPARNGSGIPARPEDLHSLGNTAITTVQERLVREIVDTLQDQNHVLYEICNECQQPSIPWQHHMIQVIRQREAGRTLRHPIGMSGGGYSPQIPNSALFESPADWIAPRDEDGQRYGTNPPPATGNKVILADSDHIPSILGSTSPLDTRRWIWKSLLRGVQPILMDAIQKGLPGWPHEDWNRPSNPGYAEGRRALGRARSYAERLDLAATSPRGDLSSTGYAVAQEGVLYLFYQPQDGPFSITLTPGAYQYEWYHPADGLVAGTGILNAGAGPLSVTPPFMGDAVLFLRRAMPSTCTPSATTRCLRQGRFQVEVRWTDFAGITSSAKVVPAGSDEAAVLAFGDPNNWEMLIKVLDGCAHNGRFWVMGAASTTVGYELRVTDTKSGQVFVHKNPLGQPSRAILSTDAFTRCDLPGPASGNWFGTPSRPPPGGLCSPDEHTLCFGGGRFKAQLSFTDFSGKSGQAHVAPFGNQQSGLLWFFEPRNWEMMVKVLNGCGINGRYWAFAAGATNVAYTLTLSDLQRGIVKRYQNPSGQPAQAHADTDFAPCP